MKDKANNKDYVVLDKLFKETLSEYKSPDALPNWELMHYMLQQEQRKKNIKKLLYLFIGAGSLLLIMLMFFLPLNIRKIVHTLYPDNTKQEGFQSKSQEEQAYLKKNKNNVKKEDFYNPADSKFYKPSGNDKLKAYKHLIKNKERNLDFNTNKKDKDMLMQNQFKVPTHPIASITPYVGREYELPLSTSKNNQGQDTSVSYYSVSHIKKDFVLEKDSVKIEVENLNVNSEYADFASVITADGEIMYFTSNRPAEVSEKKKKNNIMFENVYVCYRQKGENKFSGVQLLKSPVNVEGRHNSAIGLSNDGQRMFLYRDNEKGTGDIYECRLRGREWSEPEKLPYPINTEYHESSASLSPDERIIFFISDRPGGKGKKDIWYSTKDKNGKWGTAVPLNAINTPMDEEGVYMHPDGKTLYFSSRGLKGYGGYDVYRTTFENGTCSPPENLGSSINSPEDDLYYVPEANGRVAYYTSKKGGTADIYRVEITPIKVKKEYSAKLTLFKGKVVDKSTQEPLEAEIEITDLSSNQVLSKVVSNSATGNFLISLPFGVNYGINVKKEGYLFYSENVYVPKSEDYKELIKLIELDKIKKGERIILRNIFFEFDKANLLPESIMELDRLVELLKAYPSLKIEIGGHTDSKGNDEYNQKLSQARAEAVVDYLINKGIDKSRLKAVGYGETMPIAPNTHPDGSDNPEGRQLNRRTEFKILEY